MKKDFKFILNKLWILIAPASICLMLLVVYLIKGIYPFGTNTISYFDMAQSIVPIYYHTYDFLHGNADCFLNWNVALGSSMGDLFGNFIFFPTNLFFFFVKRENILYSMSFFLVFKLMLASAFMCIYANSKVAKKAIAVFAGIAYASCGFVIQYYTNIYFLDCFLIFPLLVLGYDFLVEKNKKILYIVCLSLVMLCNVQMIFFVCFYLFLKTFFVIFDMKKEDKGKAICRILICSACSILCGCFSFVPMAIQTLKSTRVGSNMDGGYFANIQTVLCDYQQHKNFMLYGAEFVFAVAIAIVVLRKFKAYKNILFLIALIMIPVAFEGVNLIWHLGTYQMFPLRFGFILTFECLNLLLGSYDEIEKCEFKIGKYFGYLSFGLIPMLAIVLYKFTNFFLVFGIRDTQVYLSYWLIVVILTVLYFGVLVGFSPKIKPYAFVVVAVVQAALGFYGFVGVEMNYVPECEPDIIINSEKVVKEMGEVNPLIDRTKDANMYLNANYPFITSRSSASGWMNGTTSELVYEMNRMGYDNFYIRTLDCGGTALTDAFIGYKYLISNLENNNPDLYSEIPGKEYLLKCNYSLPFGAVVDNAFESESKDFGYQNDLYRYFSGKEDNLFEEVSLEEYEGEYNEETYSYNFAFDIEVPEKSILYLYGSPLREEACEFHVNDEVILNPYLYSEKNSAFPTYYRNGFLEAGTVEGTCKIEISSPSETLEGIKIAYMSLDKFEKFIEEANASYTIQDFTVKNNELTISIKSDRDGRYIIPLGYSDSWKVTKNGYEADAIKEINDAFLAVDVHKGENNITLKYKQKGFLPGVLVSVIGLALAVLACVFDLSKYKIPNRIILTVYYVVFAIAIVYVYITPLSCNILKMLMDKLTIIDIFNYF